MKYLILTKNSQSYAEGISREFWKLRRPAGFWSDNDITSRYCASIVHDDGRVALELPSEFIAIHIDANVQPLIDLITEGLPQETRDSIAGHLNRMDRNKGNKIEDMLPIEFKNNLKDHEYMDTDGWFNNEGA